MKQKGHSKIECLKHEQQKKEGLPPKPVKEKKVKLPKEIAWELVDEVPKKTTIINNHYYNEAPKKKRSKEKRTSQEKSTKKKAEAPPPPPMVQFA